MSAVDTCLMLPTPPREEAPARTAETQARDVDCCASPSCRRPVSTKENLVCDVQRGLVWHAGCR